MGFGTLLEDEVRKIVEEKNERDEDEAAIVKRNFWRVSFATTYQYRYPDEGCSVPLNAVVRTKSWRLAKDASTLHLNL